MKGSTFFVHLLLRPQIEIKSIVVGYCLRGSVAFQRVLVNSNNSFKFQLFMGMISDNTWLNRHNRRFWWVWSNFSLLGVIQINMITLLVIRCGSQLELYLYVGLYKF